MIAAPEPVVDLASGGVEVDDAPHCANCGEPRDGDSTYRSACCYRTDNFED